MADSVFLVAGQRPDPVYAALGELVAAAGLTGVVVHTRPDRQGTVVTLRGDGAESVATRAIEALDAVAAPPPVGTRFRREAPAGPAPAAPPPAPAPPAPTPHGSGTILRAPAPPPKDPTIAIAAATRTPELVFADGTVVPVRGRLVFGREPAARPGAGDVALVTVDDPERTVSKTHFAIEARPAGVWVEDLGSTNGTHIVTAGGSPRRLDANLPTRLEPGESIKFGDLTAKLEA